MDDHQRLLDLVPAYALGALDDEEVRELEQHLAAGCADCERELFAASRDLEALAETVPAVVPAETTRARLMRRLDSRRPHRETATPPHRPWLTRVAVVAALLLLGWNLWMRFELGEEVVRQAAAREAADERLVELRGELDATRDLLFRMSLANRIVASPETSAVLLAGLDPAPGASAQTFVDPRQKRAVFYASNLPAVSADETYQLWFIAGGTPVSAGIFDVEADGSAMVLVDEIERVEEIDLWAVTVEPAGGVPQPTGSMVLKG